MATKKFVPFEKGPKDKGDKGKEGKADQAKDKKQMPMKKAKC